jgi:hypothetical protein
MWRAWGLCLTKTTRTCLLLVQVVECIRILGVTRDALKTLLGFLETTVDDPIDKQLGRLWDADP